MREELDRLQAIFKRKKQGTVGMGDSIETLKVMAARQGLETFNHPAVDTSPRESYSSDSDSQVHSQADGIFSEIVQLRNEMHSSRPNLP